MPDYGDLIIVASPKGRRKLRRLTEGEDFHTQDGFIKADDIAKISFGSEILTNMGVPLRILRPTLADLIKGVKRQTQVLYPKDIGFICVKLGVGNGRTIIEAGTGSGSLTLALSWFSGENGTVHTFEAREEFQKLAKRNLEWAGLGKNVVMHLGDIKDGFGEVHNADALFLDVRTPWEYLHHIPTAVVAGAPLAFLLPTVNQVDLLLAGLEKGPFDDVEVSEILVRNWKPVPGRLRPDDRMIAHTGFLVFARLQEKSELWNRYTPHGTRERKQELARLERLHASDSTDFGDDAPDDSDFEDKTPDACDALNSSDANFDGE